MSESPLRRNFFEKLIRLSYYSFLRFVTPYLLIISPELLSWLSHFNSEIRRLPSIKDRIIKDNDPLNEFIFYTENSTKFKEVNIVMRGDNFENLDTSIPTFFINTYKEKTEYPNRYYATTDRLMFKAMMGEPENEFLKRFNYDDPEKKFFYFMPIGPLVEENGLHSKLQDEKTSKEKINLIKKKLNYNLDYQLSICCHKYKGHNIQIGSGIISVISLLQLSKKVNVFGWDAFLDEEMPNSFFKQTSKLWSPFSDFQPVSRFSAIVLNWIYAHRLINYFSSDRLIVHGKVKNVSKLEWVEKYLYKMIYKKVKI